MLDLHRGNIFTVVWWCLLLLKHVRLVYLRQKVLLSVLTVLLIAEHEHGLVGYLLHVPVEETEEEHLV